MKKKLLALFVSVLAMAGTNVWAADPDNTLYEAALAAIQDDQDYYIQTNVNGTMYYVTTGGLLTSDRQQAGIFHITKTSGGELVGTGFRIDGGTNAYFSNPPLNGIVANLNPGVFYRNSNYDRDTWERQVLYLDGNGKYAIRSCNTQYAENSYKDAGRTFWTYSTGDAVTPCYTYTPAFIWDFVVYTPGTPHTVRFANGIEGWSVQDVTAASAVVSAPAVLENVFAGDSLVVTAPATLPGKVKSVKAAKLNPLNVPFTIEAITAGTIVVNDPKNGMKYSLNYGEKTAMSGTTTINVAAGDKVVFYGNGTSIRNYNGTIIKDGTAQVKVYGNIMSLIDEENFFTATTLTSAYALHAFFKGNTTLTDAGGLMLPATTLTTGCYQSMFNNCTNLTVAPAELPAAVLAENCYAHMFRSSGLVTVSEDMMVNATTMDRESCVSMFRECPNLTNAPTIAATTLAKLCCNAMFYGSPNVASVSKLPATTLADSCYFNMFNGCTSLTTVPSDMLPATVLVKGCYARMFRETGLTAGPELPATVLVKNCYRNMFENCASLAAVTCLATSGIDQNNSTTGWLTNAGTSATGTKIFTAASNMVDWPTSVSGIPSGWTRQNLVEVW